jgi:hypothetical protein
VVVGQRGECRVYGGCSGCPTEMNGRLTTGGDDARCIL